MAETNPTPSGDQLCPHCCKVNPPEAHFCAACNAPLSVFATTDPLARIQSMGFSYHKATHEAPSGIVVIGMWLLFFPGFLTFATMAVLSLAGMFMAFGLGGNRILGEFILSLGAFAICGPLAAVFGKMIYKTTRNYLSAKPDLEPDDDSSTDLEDADPEDQLN